MNKETKQKLVPIWERVNLTLEEAAAYSGMVLKPLQATSALRTNCPRWIHRSIRKVWRGMSAAAHTA